MKTARDPKVYAVDRGAILRWIQSESVARAMLGTSWATRVDDLPEELLAEYRIGSPIASSQDHDSIVVTLNTRTIDTEVR